MKSLMTLLTAMALFAVQPNVPNVGCPHVHDTVAAAPATDAPSSDSDEAPSRPLGQMPEIEVEQYGGELLHVTTQQFFEPILIGKLHLVPPLQPHEHTTFPLLRPPRA